MSSNKKFDIFLSYNWDHKPFVKKLYNLLCNELNFKVWIDDMELDNTPLTSQLADGINNSHIFMCCITKNTQNQETVEKSFFMRLAKTNQL